MFFEDLEALLTVGGLEDAETAVFQIGGEAGTDHVVVIDDQQRCTGFLHVGERRQIWVGVTAADTPSDATGMLSSHSLFEL